jgi:3-deoxy-D-manno-octulosonate 8-phosphate phosphatase (KDO 8-P phosphatase)
VAGPEKLEAMGALLERRGIRWEETAFVGDDLADLQVLRRVGLPIAVANAVAEVKAVASFVTRAPGGHGAVREAIEALLRARGVWPEMLERYFSEPARAV